MKLKNIVNLNTILQIISVLMILCGIAIGIYNIRYFKENFEKIDNRIQNVKNIVDINNTNIQKDINDVKYSLELSKTNYKNLEDKIKILTELIDTNNQIRDDFKENQELNKSRNYPYISWYNALAKKYNVDYSYIFEISQIVIENCKLYKVSSNHIMAMIGVESEFNKNAKSYLGQSYGSGLCQVSEIVLQEYNWHSGNKKLTSSDLFNESNNIKVAVWYYARLRDHYKIKNNLNNLMSAYNKGHKGGYAPTYVKKINTNLKLLK